MNYLGKQDVSRKRCHLLLCSGTWAGYIFIVVLGVRIFVSRSQEKWDKFLSYLRQWKAACKTAKDAGELPQFHWK
eukprot:2817477-Ditylum_brightwellii.AAC.1